MVRRIPDGNQASYHAEVQGLPWDTLKGSAEMLRNATVRPGEPSKAIERKAQEGRVSSTSEDNDHDRTTRSNS